MSLPRSLGRILRVASALGAFSVSAKNTGFLDPQKGLVMGVGTYKHWLANDNAWDPVPSLAPTGTSVSGSNGLLLLPTKFGFFMTRGSAEIETYARYMINRSGGWSSSGTFDGSGSTNFKSYGAGLNAGVAVFRANRFQLKTTVNIEYVLQRATVGFTSASDTDLLKLSSTSLLAGAGIQPELWLGDLWVLSLFAGYQYGFDRKWNVSEAGTFMGRTHAVGELKDALGRSVKAQFGGFLAEVALKLNFYQ